VTSTTRKEATPPERGAEGGTTVIPVRAWTGYNPETRRGEGLEEEIGGLVHRCPVAMDRTTA